MDDLEESLVDLQQSSIDVAAEGARALAGEGDPDAIFAELDRLETRLEETRIAVEETFRDDT